MFEPHKCICFFKVEKTTLLQKVQKCNLNILLNDYKNDIRMFGTYNIATMNYLNKSRVYVPEQINSKKYSLLRK